MIGKQIQLTQNKSEVKLHLIKMVHLRLCWHKDFLMHSKNGRLHEKYIYYILYIEEHQGE